MSELPKPSGQKAPKQIGSHALRVKEQAHDQLVRFVWENLAAVVGEVLPVRRDFFADVEEAFKLFQQEATTAAQLARALTDNVEDQLVGKALLKLATRFDAAQSIPFLEPARTLANCKVSAKLQSPLFELGYDRPRKQVGFVDFECTVLVPVRLRCNCPIPYFLTTEGMQFRKLARLSKDNPTLEEVSRAFDITPTWAAESSEHRLVIDVRPAPVPVGSLLQELKTLRSLTPSATILVVTGFCDDMLERMLDNEGIRCLSRQRIESIL